MAYVYCDYRNHQTAEDILGSIIKQLLEQLSTTPEEITELWQMHKHGETPFGIATMTETFRIICELFTQTYICLDALDECWNFYQLLDFLQQAPSSISLFCTSRNHVLPVIQSKLRHVLTIRIEAGDSDVRMLVKEHINRDHYPELMTKKLEQDIIEMMSALAHGMFVITQPIKQRTHS